MVLLRLVARAFSIAVPFALVAASCVVPPEREGVPDEPAEGAPAESADVPEPAEATAASGVVDAAWTVIGHSVEGRPIRKQVIGVGPRTVLWVGGIHGNEIEGSVATANLLESFRRAGDLEQDVTLVIVEDINPDGRAHGKRANVHGIDLNRNFPASNVRTGQNPLSEPESRVLHDLIETLDPDVVMVAHSWGRRSKGPHRFVNYDGPADRLARIFSEISGFPVKESRFLHSTPGSLGSWVGIDKQIPILTIEWERGTDPTQCWVDTREAILAVIRG